MATVEELKLQRQALERVLSTGASAVRHGDKSVQYRSAEEVERAIKRLDVSIAQLEGRRRRRVFYLSSDRGL